MRNFRRKEKFEEAPEARPPSVHGVGSLIGGSTVSLDGASVILPGEASYDGDDASSLASYRPVKMVNGGVSDDPSVLGDSIHGGVAPPPTETAPKTGDFDDDEQSTKGSWLPPWLTGASPLLKAIIIMSAALLVGSVVLVVVAAVLQSGGDSGGTTSGTTGEFALPPTVSVVVDDIEPSAAPSAVSPAEPSGVPSAEATEHPTPEPSLEPNPTPTALPSFAPTESVPTPTVRTLSPTQSGLTATTFYVTAGRFQGRNLTLLPEILKNLPTLDDTAFLVHLGDWNSPFGTGCDEESFQTVDKLFSNSSVPVYFVVGDNEYNDCPDPDQALSYWYQYLTDYPAKYWLPPRYAVSRDTPSHPENFAFVVRNALFIGVNLVGGEKHNDTEWENRIKDNLQWIQEQFDANRDSFEVMFVFLHADPDLANAVPFYTVFDQRVNSTYDVPVIVVHRNLGNEVYGVETVGGIDDYLRLVVQGQILPVMRIRFDPATNSLNYNQGTWFDNEVFPLDLRDRE